MCVNAANRPQLTSIPELIAKHGNMANACRATGLSELTISKYRLDHNCEKHIIVNNRLMTHTKTSADLYSRPGVTQTERASARD